MHNALQLVLILLAIAVLAVVVFRLLRLPPMLGYLLAGVLIGPHALGWIPDTEETRHFAEFGVVFLMFSIGLEFSLPKLVTMKRIVFGFGAAQVFLTILFVMAVSWALALDWRVGLALGGALAMSSTAIVSKMLAERLELNSAHGRQIIGVLLFQDLAVVPLLIMIPALASTGDSETDYSLMYAAALFKALMVLALILFLGQRLMRPWFHLVARQRSSELFVLNVLLITLGLAWLTDIAGLSLALGAFLAGMLISETEYRYQVEDDIKPFRDILLGLFFITIGMLLDMQVVMQNFLWVILILVSLVVLKVFLIAGLSRLFGANSSVAVRTGLNLAQGGEFGFVLLSLAGATGLVENAILQPVLAAVVLSMFVAPFIIEYSERMTQRLNKAEWMHRAMEITAIASQAMVAEEGHVIVCGYGRSGQNISRLLEKESIPFIALDLDPQRIHEAASAGESVVYGDAARRDVLVAAGIMRAKALVVSYTDTVSALKILAHVQVLRPELSVVVRTRDDADIDLLKDAGATEVVAETLEGSLMLASHVLLLLNISSGRILRCIRQTREERYQLFRGFFHGVTDEMDESEDKLSPRLLTVVIVPGAAAVNKTLGVLDLAGLGVEVTAVRRHNIRGLLPSSDIRLEAGDVVVLRGVQENLAAAEIRLLQG